MARTALPGGKLMPASEAVKLIQPGDCITVGGTIGWTYPYRLLTELEVRFLTTGEPSGLTLFDPFPTGIPGVEPLAYPGLLKRLVGGYYLPYPRLCEMIRNCDVEAYMFPLGSLSFLCQQIGAGRRGYMTKVGLGTFIDPRHGGGRLNAATTRDIVHVEEFRGREYLWYEGFPVNVALIRGSVVDEMGNLSLQDESLTMNVLSQALAAKASGGKVIVQAKRMVRRGAIDPRLVVVPGVLVDAITLDRDQHLDESAPELDWLKVTDRLPRPPAHVLAANDRGAWLRTLTDGPAPDPEIEPAASGDGSVPADGLIARRAFLEIRCGDLVNVGAGLPLREFPPVAITETVDQMMELSVESGVLGGLNNGVGFRADADAVLDTPTVFSMYAAGVPAASFLSMLEFDADGNVNLIKYGDTWVGPGGSMDIVDNVNRVVFCGTFTAGGLRVGVEDGELRILQEGTIPRGVAAVQAIAFNGRRMLADGKDVLYVTERAAFRMTADGPELFEVAPGVDVEADVLAHMCFKPRIAKDVRRMDPRVFTRGLMGLRDAWELDLATSP